MSDKSFAEDMAERAQAEIDSSILVGDDLDSCCDKCASCEHSTEDHPPEEDVPVL